MRDLKRRRDAGNRRVPVPAPCEIGWIIAAEPFFPVKIGRALGQQPLRIAASIPFGADVRPGTKNHLQSELIGRHREPIMQVGHIKFGKIIRPAGWRLLVIVPCHICFDGVETGLFEFAKAIGPKLFGASKIVERTAENDHVVSVDRDTMLVELESAPAIGGRRSPAIQSNCRREEQNPDHDPFQIPLHYASSNMKPDPQNILL